LAKGPLCKTTLETIPAISPKKFKDSGKKDSKGKTRAGAEG